MTIDPSAQILDAIDGALAGMSPEDRADALRQCLDDSRSTLEHIRDLPPAERDTALREMTAEYKRLAADITAAGPAALHQFAHQAAHTLRLRGTHGPVLDEQEKTRVAAALDRAQRRHKAFRACRHILAGGPVIARGGAHLCIAHPEHGARCQDCHELHVTTTHDPIEERTCDHCRTVLDEIYPCAAVGPAAFRAVTPNRRTRYVPALLAVVGIGYCEPCRDQRGTSLTNIHQAAPRAAR